MTWPPQVTGAAIAVAIILVLCVLGAASRSDDGEARSDDGDA